jgi:hypothetical protein
MLRIKIETKNAAFEEKEYECSRILRKVADQLDEGFTEGLCTDTNGNTVGAWELTKR